MLHAAWKSLLGRKVRLLLSTFAIVLGVAFVAGTLVFTDTLHKSFTNIFDNSVGDVVVQPRGTADAGGQETNLTIPASLVGRLAHLPGAARADGNVVSFGVFVVDTHNKVIGGQGAPGLAFNDSDAPAAHGAEPLQVVEGAHPHGPDQVVLDRSTARRAGYRIGDTVHLVNAGSRALLTPRLVGLAGFPGGGSLNGATATIWDTATAQRLFAHGKDVFTNVWVTARPGVSQSDLRAQVAKVIPASLTALTGDRAAQDSASALLKAISFITIFLLVFAGISLVVGSFLIVNTFSILVAQRSRELALFRALGASRRQVTRSVQFEALVVGLFGSTVGLGLGVLLAIGIRALFASFGLDLSGTPLVFRARTVVASYAVGVLVTLVASHFPARRSARIPPIAALRDDVALPESSVRRRLLGGVLMLLAGLGVGAVGLFAGVPRAGLWIGLGALLCLLGTAAASPMIARPFLTLAAAAYARMFGTVGQLAGQNALRNPRRTAATASALMIGLALVTTMSIAGTSAKASVDETIRKNFLGDLVVSNAIGQGFSPSVATSVSRVPGVGSITRVRFEPGKLAGESHYITGIDPTHLHDVVRLQFTHGSLSGLNDATMLVSDKVAAKQHYRVGQRLVWTFPAGSRTFTVAGIFEASPAVGTGYAATLGALTRAGFKAEDNYLYVKLSPGADASSVQAAVEHATASLPTVTVKNQVEFAAEQRKPIDRLVTLIYALLGLALVIAVLGVVNTLGLSVIERTREIGLLRAIGLGRRQLRRMVGLESVVIAVLGALLGIALGLVFGISLMSSLRDQGLEVTRVPWVSLALYLVAAGVIGVLASILPARRAARLDVLSAIATD